MILSTIIIMCCLGGELVKELNAGGISGTLSV